MAGQKGLVSFKSYRFDAEVAEFVITLFPVGHKLFVGHGFTSLIKVSFDAVVNCYLGILPLCEALGLYLDPDGAVMFSRGDAAARDEG